MKTKIQRHFTSHQITVHYWALLTIFVFPVVLLLAASRGIGYGASFVIGISASFSVLVMNALMERRLWIFTHPWRRCFEATDFAFKLAMVSGVILLLIETSLLVFFFTDKSLDASTMNLILSRNCQSPPQALREICSFVLTR